MKISAVPKNLKRLFSRYDVYWLVSLALLLRVFQRGSSSYGVTGELYRDMAVLYNFLHFGHWPLLGPSSSLGGFYFGAAYYYLLAPFVWLFGLAPYGATAASACFSVLSVWMLYRLLRLWFLDANVARWGAFFLAVCVLDIQNSYYVSNPNLLPFFLLWFFYCLTKIISGAKLWRYYLGLAASFAIATQLHATALLLLPVVLAAVLVVRKETIPPARALAMAGLAGFLYLPYLVFEFHSRFANTAGIFHLGRQNFGLAIPVPSLVAIATFWQSWFVSRSPYFDFFQENFFLACGLLAALVAALAWVVLQRKQSGLARNFFAAPAAGAKLLLFSWLGIGTAMFLFFQRAIQPFYFLALWPLPIIMFAWLVAALAQSRKFWGLALAVVFVAAQAVQLWYFYPKVYDPAFGHHNLLSDFSRIKNQAGGHSYLVLNEFMDANQFQYYKTLTGTGRAGSTRNAEELFVVCLKSDPGSCKISDNPYVEKSQEPFNGLLIALYQR